MKKITCYISFTSMLNQDCVKTTILHNEKKSSASSRILDFKLEETLCILMKFRNKRKINWITV